MPSGLGQDALAGVDQDDGQVGGRGAGRHVAGVLLVARGVGDDELPPLGGEEPVGDVDGDALLALGRRPSTQQGEVELARPGCRPSASRPRARQAGPRRELRLVQQPPDQRALAVVDAAAGDEPQEPLALVRPQVGVDVIGDQVLAGSVIRSSPPASSSPSSRPSRGRSPVLGARRSGPAASPAMIPSACRLRLDRACERVAAQRPEPDLLQLPAARPAASGIRSSSTMISVPSRSTTGRSAAR